MASLNPQQQRAVRHPGGLLIVEAGPGSGKTRVIQARVEYLCQKLNVPPRRILVLTFTAKSAAELVERINTGSGARVAAKTFHAFCRQLLSAHGGLVGVRPGFDIIQPPAQHRLLRELLNGEEATAAGTSSSHSSHGGSKRPLGHLDDDADDDADGTGRGDDQSLKQLLEAVQACKAAMLLGDEPPPPQQQQLLLPPPPPQQPSPPQQQPSPWAQYVEQHQLSPMPSPSFL